MNPALEELASLYVLDELTPTERTAFEARLLQDPALAALVRELESALAARIRALPPCEPSPDVLARLETQLDRRGAAAGAEAGHAAGWRWAVLGGMAALLLAGVGVGLFRHAFPNVAGGGRPVVIIAALGSSRSASTELTLGRGPTGTDARFIQLASLAQRFWDHPDALPVKVVAAPGGSRGYAVFDPGTEQGYIAVRDVPVPAPGRRYHLWIADTASGRARDLGALPLATGTGGMYFFSATDLSERNPRRLTFFITTEPTTASPRALPRGSVVLGENPT